MFEMVVNIMRKSMVVTTVFVLILCAVDVRGGQSTAPPPLSPQEFLDLIGQGLNLLPSSMTLEELSTSMAVLPSLNEQSLAALLQGLNIDVRSPSQLGNALTVFQSLHGLLSWGTFQLPDGNAGDLLHLLSTMDEQSLKLLLQSLQIDVLTSAQFGDALNLLRDLEKALSEENKQPPNGNANDLLNMLSMMDEKSLTLLLQRLNMDVLDPSQIGDVLHLLQGLQGSLSNGTNFNPLKYLEFNTISPGCNASLSVLFSDVTEQKPWALQMIDAWGKPHSGILTGNTKWSGSFDQCLGIQPDVPRETSFETSYCVAGIDKTQQLGMCLPKICTDADVHSIANAREAGYWNSVMTTIPSNVLALIPLSETPNVTFARCQREIEYDTKAIIAICVCAIFLAMMVFATWFDVFVVCPELKRIAKLLVVEAGEEEDVIKSTNGISRISTVENGASPEFVEIDLETKNGHIQTYHSGSMYKLHDETFQTNNKGSSKYQGTCAKLVLSFSVWTNGRKLLSTEQGGGALTAINGIRFLSMTWVILGHTYFYGLQYTVNKSQLAYTILTRRSFTVIANALPVDTFFALSGLLVAYLFMKEMKRERGRINWFMFYFHRFWRLTPPYMLVMMMDIALFRYLSDGPAWKPKGFETDMCKEEWWAHLVYVNNFVSRDDNELLSCFGWSWYLATDMQFYVISPLLLVPLYFSKKIGGVVCAIFLLGVTITTVVISLHYQLPVTLVSLSPGNWDYFWKYFNKPYCRMGPYIVGILTGCVLYKTESKYKIKTTMNLCIWAFMAALACIVLYGTYEEINGNPMSVGIAALYNAVHKTLWGVCVCWVVFACVTGNGGFVNTLLSWSPFVPLGRLTYCTYLVHPMIIGAYYRSLRHGIYVTDIHVIYLFMGHLVLSYLVAFVTSLAFESPMMALEKAILRKDMKKTK